MNDIGCIREQSPTMYIKHTMYKIESEERRNILAGKKQILFIRWYIY